MGVPVNRSFTRIVTEIIKDLKDKPIFLLAIFFGLLLLAIGIYDIRKIPILGIFLLLIFIITLLASRTNSKIGFFLLLVFAEISIFVLYFFSDVNSK